MRYFFFVLLLTVAPVFSFPLQAEVIDGTQIDASGANLIVDDSSFSLTVFQTPDNSPNNVDPTTVFGFIEVDFLGGFATLDFDGTVLDEGSGWYVVSPNDVFTAQTIGNGGFTNLIGANQFLDIELMAEVGQSFFLGVNTGNSFLPNGNPSREHFGWAELAVSNFNGELTVLDSAVA